MYAKALAVCLAAAAGLTSAAAWAWRVVLGRLRSWRVYTRSTPRFSESLFKSYPSYVRGLQGMVLS